LNDKAAEILSNLIQFVGDPFVDTGVAVLECRLGKVCSEFTAEDLARQADELSAIYAKTVWMGYLTTHFPNSCWCNFNIKDAEKQKQISELVRAFEKPALADRLCVYCRRAAQHVADRKMIPLITNATTMMCGPGGEPGSCVCSGCLNGKPMFWWTPHHDWMAGLTRNFLDRVERVVQGSSDKITNLGWPSTRLLESAIEVMEAVAETDGELPAVDLTGCHATNIGSGPEYDEYRLRRGLLEFLRTAERYAAFRAIRDGAWETEGTGKRKKPKDEESKPDKGKRNALYEDLGAQLRSTTAVRDSVIRRYFRPQAGKTEGVFQLACIYARKVLEMTQQQVEAIKELADRIAASKHAERHLNRLFQRRGFTRYVQTLAGINDRMKRGGEVPIGLDTILRAFDLVGEDDATGRDALLVGELILIRLIEVLPQEKVQEIAELVPADPDKEQEE
jgi:hypothetical protein